MAPAQIRRYHTGTVIVGGGLAGIVTALELIDRGRHVVLLERTATVGGLAAQAFGGMHLVDTPLQRRMGIRDDGELSQIAQAQKLPYNRKTCSLLPQLQIEGIATATGAAHVTLGGADDIGKVLDTAFAAAQGGRPVIVMSRSTTRRQRASRAAF